MFCIQNIQMDDCWEDVLCVIIFYSVTIAWQYNILYNAVWSHWNCTSCGIVKTSFHHRWFLAHLNHVRGQISFYLVKYFGAEQIQVTPNLIYVYSGRVVHFWFHYIIKHFLYEYPVSNLLEKVKDLDAGLITKYLDQYMIQSCKNNVSWDAECNYF